LITGGSGFLGRHLVHALERTGKWRIVAPRSRELNLLNYNQTFEYLQDNDVQHIVHAAGLVGGIGLNKSMPGRMITDNLRMGLNIVESAANRGNVRVSIISTVCVYPEKAAVPTPESAMFDGYPAPDTAPYGIAKRTLWTVADSLCRERGLSYRYIIPTNLYGPGDHFDGEKAHVVPALIQRVLEAVRDGKKELTVWGDGSPTRDLLFIDDAVQGIMLAHQHPARTLTVNLSSGREISIRELAELICRLTGFKGQLVWDKDKPSGAPRRRLDGSRAKELLDFEPGTDLSDGLIHTIEWYQTTLRNEVVNE
jgi:GDP-L-fucose synthase